MQNDALPQARDASSAPALVFDKYRVTRRLAVGGMGEVFLASQAVHGTERLVVLKALLPEFSDDATYVNQFLDEGQVVASLNHPNIVSVYDVGAWQGTFYLAMEYIRGRNLVEVQRLVPGGQVLPLAAAHVICEAARGLDHAHRATDSTGNPLGIVHRDVSPQNIMVREDGLTKVVDFGIAFANTRSTRTRTGVVKGKFGYMAPEQLGGKAPDPSADQFSLGVVLWELLTGQRLFRGQDDLETLRRLQRLEVPAPSRIVDCPAELDRIVLRMLQRAPQSRFATCAEVVSELETVMAGLGKGPPLVLRLMNELNSVVTPMTVRPSDFVVSLDDESKLHPIDLTLEGEAQADEVTIESLRRPALVPPAPPRRGAAVLGAILTVSVLALLLVGGLLSQPPRAPGVRPPEPVVATALPSTPTPPPPPARPALLTITTSVPKANVRLDGRRAEGTTDLTLEPGRVHHLLIEAKGFMDYEEEVVLDEGERRVLEVTLRPMPVPPARKESTPGFISLATTPWAKVNIDGDPLGSTPLFKYKLSPGKHRLELINEGAGVHALTEFQVTTQAVLKLTCAPSGGEARCAVARKGSSLSARLPTDP